MEDDKAKRKREIEEEAARFHGQIEAMEQERKKFKRGVGCIVFVFVIILGIVYFIIKALG